MRIKFKDEGRYNKIEQVNFLLCMNNMINQQTQTDNNQNRTEHCFTYPFPIYIKSWNIYTKKRGKQLESHQQEYREPLLIATINNIDQFFLYYTSLKLPSELQQDVKVMLFQSHCRPLWEDWLHSGCLIIQFKETKQHSESRLLDHVWELLVFSLVGSQIDQDIIGLCLNKHQKITLIQIWLKTPEKKQIIADNLEVLICKDIQSTIPMLRKKIDFKFKEHSESMKNQSTMKGAHNLKPSKRSLGKP